MPPEGKLMVCLIHYCIPRAKNNAWHMEDAGKKWLKNGEYEALDGRTGIRHPPAAFPWVVPGHPGIELEPTLTWQWAGLPPPHGDACAADRDRPSQQFGMFYREGRGSMMSFRSAAPAPPKFDLLSLEFQVQVDHRMGVQEVTFEGSEQGSGPGSSWCLERNVLRVEERGREAGSR